MAKGWDDALEAQNDLRASFHTAQGARYMEAFADSLGGEGKRFDINTLEMIPGEPAAARDSVALSVATIEYSDPMWVSADVVELVEFAAETFKPEAIMPDDLFVPAAFGYLERPLAIIDVHGKRAAFRAVSWMQVQYGDNPGERGVAICLWSHCEDQDDYGTGIGLIGNSALSLMHSGHVKFGDERSLHEPVYRDLARQLQVLWRLAEQEVIVPGRERVSRPVWRRRSNWRQIKEVQVLRLRRAKPSKYEGPERDVEWSHRWFVHGHWRNQWYPSIQQHMQIWIDGYIKGPDDKPFIPKRRAIEFIR